ncbi:hypothetical protein V3C99_008392 [Haemonchus contortus]|uniref:Protein F13H10.9 n=1 Tax=Haemonchus contortus TaxID=6289 RepID=W6NNB8_HAECO
MTHLSQEMISMGIMVVLCVILSVLCVIFWMVKWRRNLLPRKEEEGSNQCEIGSYTEKTRQRSLSIRAVADSIAPPKRADSIDGEKSHRSGSYKGSRLSIQQPKQEEVIDKVEQGVPQRYVPKPLERIKEESTPARNKRLDTVSVMSSMETLHRNDSKVNVFPADKMEEIDLNPGLNNVIDLETI